MSLLDGEPLFGPWRPRRIDDLLDDLGRPRIVAVDGRGGGGKTTAAERIAARVPGAAVVHTDDVAWHHAMFAWAELMADGVLRPVRREEAFWDEWQAEERPFLAADRPWERADVVVDGAPAVPYDPATELVVSDGEVRSPLP